MPKVSIYLPDDLYRRVREHALPLSALAQQAAETALRQASVDDWIERMRLLEPQTRHPIDTSALMDTVRNEFGR